MEKHSHVGLIVNCTRNLPFPRDRENIQCYRVPIEDNGNYETTACEYWDTATNIMLDYLQAGRGVVVHCLAGQQRSPALVAAYLIRFYRFPLEDAIHYVRAAKPDAFFGAVNFMPSLKAWDERFNGPM